MTITMDLDQRLSEATTSDNKWNSWPDQLEVVDLKLYDHFDPHAMFEIGRLLERATAHRQIAYKVFSHREAGYDNEDKPLARIRRALPKPRHGEYHKDSALISVAFALAQPHGQEDDATRRNIHAVFAPPTRYSGLMQRYELLDHGLVVTIGCKHEIDDAGSNHNRGFHRGKCTRCGWTFYIDSSD